jgi:hypothetical protein
VFVEAGRDAARILEAIDKSFDLVALDKSSMSAWPGVMTMPIGARRSGSNVGPD